MLSKLIKITITFCLIFVFLNITARSANATQVKFKPQITVGDFKAGVEKDISNNTNAIGTYIKQIYNYAVGAVGIFAVVVMMFGGVIWMTSMGNPSRVTEAKSWITAALTGLLLVMSSYVILKTINPDLVNLKVRIIPPIKLAATETAENAEKECTDKDGTLLKKTTASDGKNDCINKICTLSKTILESSSGVIPLTDGTNDYCCVCTTSSIGTTGCYGINNYDACTTSAGGKGYCHGTGTCSPCEVAGGGYLGMSKCENTCCSGVCNVMGTTCCGSAGRNIYGACN